MHEPKKMFHQVLKNLHFLAKKRSYVQVNPFIFSTNS